MAAALSIKVNEPFEWTRDPATPNVMTLNGYGLSLTVARGHLLLADGIGPYRRERRLSRAQRDVDRIVVIGQTGHVTLEALRWCSDTGISVVQLDSQGRIGLLATTDGRDDPRLRRAQALSVVNGNDLQAARTLIAAKLRGQHDTLIRHRLAEPGQGLSRFVELATEAPTIVDLASTEATAALRYFQRWDGVTVQFAHRDEDRVPEHWKRFRTRGSAIHPGPGARDAADPINALLNYGYALAEIECTIALRTLGLDPGMGVMHVDKKNRDSLALDLIEPIRPIVDGLILGLLDRCTFTPDDFIESRNGGCRLNPTLGSELASILTDIRPAVATQAEELVRLLADGAPQAMVGTPLTRTNWKKANGRTETAPSALASVRTKACRNCGTSLEFRHRTLCVECWKERRQELGATNSAALNEHLAELRAQGRDPRSTEQARNRRRAANTASNRARYEWTPTDAEAALTDEWFNSEIKPLLLTVERREIQQALGISDTAAGKIRGGRLRPHRRHWTTLARLLQIETETVGHAT